MTDIKTILESGTPADIAKAYHRAGDNETKHEATQVRIVEIAVTSERFEILTALAEEAERKFPGKAKQEQRNKRLSVIRTRIARECKAQERETKLTVKKVGKPKAWAVVELEWPEPNPDAALQKALKVLAENRDRKDVQQFLISQVEELKAELKKTA